MGGRIRIRAGDSVLQSEEYPQFVGHNVEGGSIHNAEIAGEAGGMDVASLCRRSVDRVFRFVERNSGLAGSRTRSDGRSWLGMTDEI